MAMAQIPDTLANYLVAATAIPISPDLIGPASIESILPIAALLPGAITSFFGFECPLGSDEPRADFLVSVKPEGRPILAGLSQERWLPAGFTIHPVWERVAQFASLWADPQSALHGRVHNMWLEFDIHDSPPAIPVPSVFFGALDGILCANAGSDWLTEVALPALQPGLDSGTLRSVGRCIACLPSGAWIFQVGLMLARPAQVARLCIRGIAPAEVTGFLQAAGWQGPAVEVQTLLDRFAPYSQRVDLDIDVATDLRPKIGLECYPEPFPAGRARLIDSVEEQGLCRPAKAAALRSSTVFTHERIHRKVWPPELLSVSNVLDSRLESIFLRGLHHIKIVFEPGCALHAKAYLAVRQDWMPPEYLLQMVQERRGAGFPAAAAVETLSC